MMISLLSGAIPFRRVFRVPCGRIILASLHLPVIVMCVPSRRFMALLAAVILVAGLDARVARGDVVLLSQSRMNEVSIAYPNPLVGPRIEESQAASAPNLGPWNNTLNLSANGPSARVTQTSSFSSGPQAQISVAMSAVASRLGSGTGAFARSTFSLVFDIVGGPSTLLSEFTRSSVGFGSEGITYVSLAGPTSFAWGFQSGQTMPFPPSPFQTVLGNGRYVLTVQVQGGASHPTNSIGSGTLNVEMTIVPSPSIASGGILVLGMLRPRRVGCIVASRATASE